MEITSAKQIKEITGGVLPTKLVVLNQDEMEGTWTYTKAGQMYVDLDNEPELDENYHTLGWMARMEEILEIYVGIERVWAAA